MILIFLILTFTGWKLINNSIVRLSYIVHSLGVFCFFYLPFVLNYNSDSSFFYLILTSVLLHFFLTIFLIFLNIKNHKLKIVFDSPSSKFDLYSILFFALLYILFFFNYFSKFENLLLMRKYDNSSNVFIGFDLLKNLISASSVLFFVLFLNSHEKNKKKKLLYLSMVVVSVTLLISFGSRNFFAILILPILLITYIQKKYQILLFLIPLIIASIFVTNYRDFGISTNQNFSSNSFRIQDLIAPFDNLNDAKNIYDSYFDYELRKFPLNMAYEFYEGLIPRKIYDYFNLNKTTYDYYLDWNYKNVNNKGNLTPSYLGQVILENGLWGLIFFPINFILILLPHIKVINYFSKRLNNSIANIVLLSLFLGGIFNITRMINIIYLLPFWSFTLFLFFRRK